MIAVILGSLAFMVVIVGVPVALFLWWAKSEYPKHHGS